jgi:hypothetical protein
MSENACQRAVLASKFLRKNFGRRVPAGLFWDKKKKTPFGLVSRLDLVKDFPQ